MLKRLIEILNEKGLDAQSFLFLYAVLNNIECPKFEIDYKKLRIKKYWEYQEAPVDSKLSVTPEGVEFVKYVVKEIKKEIAKDNRSSANNIKDSITEWIDEYRDLFKGLKSGAQGDKTACITKMIRFFDEYPQFANKEQVLKATKAYINNEARSNYKYIQKAHYFIFKREDGKNAVDISNLASYCSDVEDNVLKSNIRDLN